MGRHHLIARQLASGELVQVLPDAILDDARIGWWLVTPKGNLSGAASAFRDWMSELASQDALD
jgi:LysR family transcriptional regulator, glycine cleavage system transcriptional activator